MPSSKSSRSKANSRVRKTVTTYRNNETKKARLNFDVKKMDKSMRGYIDDNFSDRLKYKDINGEEKKIKIGLSGGQYAMSAALQKLTTDVVTEVFKNTEKSPIDNLCHVTFSSFKTSILADNDMRECFSRYITKYQDIKYDIPLFDEDLIFLVNGISKDLIFERSAEHLLRFLICSIFSDIMRHVVEHLLFDKKRQISDKFVSFSFRLLFDSNNRFSKSILKFINTTMSFVNASEFDKEEEDVASENEDEEEEYDDDEEEEYDEEYEDAEDEDVEVDEDEDVDEDDEEVEVDEDDEEVEVEDEEEYEEYEEKKKPARKPKAKKAPARSRKSNRGKKRVKGN